MKQYGINLLVILAICSPLAFAQLFCSGGCGGGGTVIPSQNDFRLTLATGYPVYAPGQFAVTSTNTSGDTVSTTTDPGIVTGTIITVQTTSGGLTAGTRYFARRRSSTLYSFHTTVAGAEGDSATVDITGNQGTNKFNPSGVSATTLRLTPSAGCTSFSTACSSVTGHISLYSGTVWADFTTSEISIALGTLTSGFNYDAFAYNNGGTVTLELSTSWGSDTIRTSTTLTSQDGVPVKGTDATRRYVGTFRTDSTTTTIDDAGGISSQVGGKRFVFNAANPKNREVIVWDGAASWTYNTATWRQANGNAGNKVEWVDGLGQASIDMLLAAGAGFSSSTAGGASAIGIDQTTDGYYSGANSIVGHVATGTTGGVPTSPVRFNRTIGVGYHFAAWLEIGNGVAGMSQVGKDTANLRGNGLQGFIWM